MIKKNYGYNPFTGKLDATKDLSNYYTKTEMDDILWVRDPVEDWWDPSEGLPVDPEDGDRYIADGDGSGWYDGYIYEWDEDEGEWVEEIPIEGWMIWMLFELVYYVFFSGGWMEVGSDTYVHIDGADQYGASQYDLLQLNGAGEWVNISNLDYAGYIHTTVSSTTALQVGSALVVDTTNGALSLGGNTTIQYDDNAGTASTDTYLLINNSRQANSKILEAYWQGSAIKDTPAVNLANLSIYGLGDFSSSTKISTVWSSSKNQWTWAFFSGTPANGTLIDSDDFFAMRANGDANDYLTISTVADVPTLGTVGSCNLSLTSSSGIISFGTPENLVLNFNTPNTVGISSTTGVTDIDWSALNHTTTGTGRFDGGVGIGTAPSYPLHISKSYANATVSTLCNVTGIWDYDAGDIGPLLYGTSTTITNRADLTGEDFGGDTYTVEAIGGFNACYAQSDHSRISSMGGAMSDTAIAMENQVQRGGTWTSAMDGGITCTNIGLNNETLNAMTINNAAASVAINNYGGRFYVYDETHLTAGSATVTNYGNYVYIDASGAGTSTSYGLYLATITGDTTYAIYNASNAPSDFGSGDITTTGTLGVGAITGTSLTDGTATLDDGSLTGAVNGTFSATVQAEHLYTTDDLVVDDDATFPSNEEWIYSGANGNSVFNMYFKQYVNYAAISADPTSPWGTEVWTDDESHYNALKYYDGDRWGMFIEGGVGAGYGGVMVKVIFPVTYVDSDFISFTPYGGGYLGNYGGTPNGETFGIYIWNFNDTQWDLVASSTIDEIFGDTVLAGDYISSGVVYILMRNVDDATGDWYLWFDYLSLGWKKKLVLADGVIEGGLKINGNLNITGSFTPTDLVPAAGSTNVIGTSTTSFLNAYIDDLFVNDNIRLGDISNLPGGTDVPIEIYLDHADSGSNDQLEYSTYLSDASVSTPTRVSYHRRSGTSDGVYTHIEQKIMFAPNWNDGGNNQTWYGTMFTLDDVINWYSAPDPGPVYSATLNTLCPLVAHLEIPGGDAQAINNMDWYSFIAFQPTLDVISSTGKQAAMWSDGNIFIESDTRGLYLGVGQDISFKFNGSDLIINSENITANDEIHFTNFDGYLFDNKIILTQADGNEYIDSLNDGYVDIGATTGIRLKRDTTLDANMDLVLSGTGYVDSPSYKAGGTAPVADATYAVYNDGVTSGQVTSITTKGGIITAIAVIP